MAQAKHIVTSEPQGVTGKLSTWVTTNNFDSIPPDVLERAKHLLLDGIACSIVGAHLPWSEKAVAGVTAIEPDGKCTIIGWGGKKLSALSATLLNSTFIQGFELDDYHSVAPLHSNALLLPALFSAIESNLSDHPISGRDFLAALTTGYEIGPRVGLALHGADLLSRGWHSGAVQGPAAVAAAVCNLLEMTPAQTEWALGTACTQAGGLMSAQFGSDAKRMQHGFSARSGMLAASLAKANYTGIEQVFEIPYGGFLAAFSQGANFERKMLPEELISGLGSRWEIWNIRVKLHAAMAALHATIDCVEDLQQKYPERLSPEKLDDIKSIKTEHSKPAFEHGGWVADPAKPITSVGAQMSIQYAAAAQFVDREVLMAQFGADKLNRGIVRNLMAKVKPEHNANFDTQKSMGFQTKMTVDFADGESIDTIIRAPKGIEPACSNEDIVHKWRSLVKGVLSEERRDKIESLVLKLEGCDDLRELLEHLKEDVPCPIKV